jgi:hypothetical protein
VALVGLGFLVFGSHVRHGGFYSDDWANAAAYHFDGWWKTSVYEWRHEIPGRPLLALLHPLPYAVLGLKTSHNLAAAIVLAALTSLSFFELLRVLGIELPHALAIALLAFVFPWADAARLWPTGAMNNVAVMAYFLGTIAAARGLALWQTRRRKALALHALASLLYLVSVVTYEVAAAAILLSGLLYRAVVPWRELRKRWLVDAVLVVVPLAVSIPLTSRVRYVASPGARVADIPQFVKEGLSLFASIFVPPNLSRSWGASWELTSPAAGKLIVLSGVVTVVVVALVRFRQGRGDALRPWLYRFAAGVLGVAAAQVMFMGSGLAPLTFPGIDDRTNTFAAFGFVLAAYSVLALAALLIGGGRGTTAAIVLTAVVVLIGLGLIQRVEDDVHSYDDAAAAQRQFLGRLHSALPRPPPGTTIFSFGYPAQTAPGVPIFVNPSDVRGAVDLLWNERSLRAVPIHLRQVSCDVAGVAVPRLRLGGTEYGRSIFVDVRSGESRQIGSRRQCARALEVFKPGRSLGHWR